MRRTTPLALLLGAVFLTAAATAQITPGALNPTLFWIVGGGSVLVFIGSESRWLRERVWFLRSHSSRLRRLIERGQALRMEMNGYSQDARGHLELAAAYVDRLHRWADDSDAFARDLDEPTFAYGLANRVPGLNGLQVFYLYVENFVETRQAKLVALNDAAHRADRG